MAAFPDVKAPTEALDGFLIATSVAVWVGAILADWAAFRVDAPLEATLPVGDPVHARSRARRRRRPRPAHRALGRVALAFVLLRRADRLGRTATWVGERTSRSARGRWSLLGAGLALAAVAIAALVGPRLPGAPERRHRVAHRHRRQRPRHPGHGQSRWSTSAPASSTRPTSRSSPSAARCATTGGSPPSTGSTDASGRRTARTARPAATSTTACPSQSEQHRVRADVLDRGPRPDLAAGRVRAPGDQLGHAGPLRRGVRARSSSTPTSRPPTTPTTASPSALPQLRRRRSSPRRRATIPSTIAEHLPRPPGRLPRLGARRWPSEVTGGSASAYEAVAATAELLPRPSSPTTSTSGPGHSDQAIEQFVLELRRGYCEQFAGSFAAMARSLGIPARVAVGFTPGDADPADPTLYRVRGENAHAWPEVFLGEYGWVTFEPTPGPGRPVRRAVHRRARAAGRRPAATARPPPPPCRRRRPTPVDPPATDRARPTRRTRSTSSAPAPAPTDSRPRPIRGRAASPGDRVGVVLAVAVVSVWSSWPSPSLRRRAAPLGRPCDADAKVALAWDDSIARHPPGRRAGPGRPRPSTRSPAGSGPACPSLERAAPARWPAPCRTSPTRPARPEPEVGDDSARPRRRDRRRRRRPP